MMRRIPIFRLLDKICISRIDRRPATAQNKMASQSAEKRKQPDDEALQIALFTVVFICTANQDGNPQLIDSQQTNTTKGNELRIVH